MADEFALFDDRRLYRRSAIRELLEPEPSDRTLDVILAKIPRIAPTKRMILYRGCDLNRIFSPASGGVQPRSLST